MDKLLASCFVVKQDMTMFSKFSHKERKKLLTASAIVAFLFICWIIFGPNGSLKYYQVTKELAAVRAENQELEKQNKALRKEVAKLLSDPEYIEETARKEYGLIQKNEIIFEFQQKKKKR